MRCRILASYSKSRVVSEPRLFCAANFCTISSVA
jgi:hypothetical protein